jgi:hypothetical protein
MAAGALPAADNGTLHPEHPLQGEAAVSRRSKPLFAKNPFDFAHWLGEGILEPLAPRAVFRNLGRFPLQDSEGCVNQRRLK